MDGPGDTADDQNRLKRENEQLRARLADLETIITMMPVPIAISEDSDGQHVEVNPAFGALLGVDTDVDVSGYGREAGKLPFKFYRNGRLVEPQDLPMPEAARKGQEVHDELEIVRDDGLRYHIFGYARPLFDEVGKVRRTFSAFVDVTERKRAERALEQSMQALRNANEELQQFAYAASHDLQEPLRTIASYAQLLDRRYTADKDASEYTGFIVEGVNRMNALIRDLLTYSRVGGTENLKRVPLNMNLALQWAMLNLDRSIREHKATLTQDTLPEVIADETQMVQLFQNLIGNSIKYRSDLQPLIHVGAEEGTDECIFSVRDNGVGIEPKFARQVFGVFKRLHGRDVPGTGIGLAICRKIVENHGGRIWVESDGKNGSCFKFALPT